MSHAIQRAQERYGLTITNADLLVMEDMFARRHPAILVVYHADGASFIVIHWAGLMLNAIVNPLGRVITFLPQSCSQAARAPRLPKRKRRNSAHPRSKALRQVGKRPKAVQESWE